MKKVLEHTALRNLVFASFFLGSATMATARPNAYNCKIIDYSGTNEVNVEEFIYVVGSGHLTYTTANSEISIHYLNGNDRLLVRIQPSDNYRREAFSDYQGTPTYISLSYSDESNNASLYCRM